MRVVTDPLEDTRIMNNDLEMLRLLVREREVTFHAKTRVRVCVGVRVRACMCARHVTLMFGFVVAINAGRIRLIFSLILNLI